MDYVESTGKERRDTRFDTFGRLSYSSMVYSIDLTIATLRQILPRSKSNVLTKLRMETTSKPLVRRIPAVAICICALMLCPLAQSSALVSVGPAEMECPSQEDGENAEEELVVLSSIRIRVNQERGSRLQRDRATSDRSIPPLSTSRRVPAIVGHQFANGLCAPLLI